MAGSDGLGLDHVGLLVRDLDRGAETWRRLGFRLSARSPQMGLDRTGERFEPWASANHCAVLQRGYLELIGIHRPELFNPWERWLARFEGAHIGAYRCQDADATYAAVSARSRDFEPPVTRRRDAPYGQGTREMRFRNIFSRDDRVAEGRYILIQHQTPEVLWQPALMEHPNGARALQALTYVGDRPAEIAARITAMCAPGSPVHTSAPVAGTNLGLPGGGSVEILSPQQFEKRFPACRPPALPCIGAFTVAVTSLAETTAWLRSRDVPYRGRPPRLWIEAAHGNGCVTELVPVG